MPDHSYEDLTLDRFWDDLVESSEPDASHVDPERAAVVRRLHALAEAPVPGAARERVRQALLSSRASPTLGTVPLSTSEEFEAVAAPHPSVDTHSLARLTARPLMRYAALAALLLLVLGGIIGSIRLVDRLQGEEPAMIQAPGFGPDTATPSDVTEKTLLGVTLPIDRIPTADRPSTPLIYWSVPPGTQDSWSASDDCCTDPRILYIVDGAYTVRADGPARVIRAGGQPETVSAETELTLGPGDAIAPSAGVRLNLSNSGSTPVYLLTWALFDPEIPSYLAARSGTWPQSWVILDYVSESKYPPVSKGSVRFLLREVTLAEGATLAPSVNSSVQLFLKANVQSSSIRENSDGSIVNQGSTQTTIYVITLQPAETSSEGSSQTDESLVEITVPADAFSNPIPGGDRLSLAGAHMTIPAGTTTTWDSDVRDDYPGPEVEYILDGSVSVTSEGPVQVIRADGDGTPENQAAGAQVLLGRGDTLIHRLEHQVVWTTGDTSAELIVGAAIANTRISNFVPEEWVGLEHAGTDNIGPVPTSSSVLRIRRVAMEPDEVVTFPPEFLQLSLIHGGGPGFLGEDSDGSITLMGAKETTIVYFFSIEPADLSSVAPNFDP